MRKEREGRPDYSTDYLQALDSNDAEILTELASHDPRNISLLARQLKKPIETVRYRYNRMVRILGLAVTAYPVYSKLGLERVSVFCFSSPKRLRDLGRALENLDYWTYLARIYGAADGYYGVYALPAGQSEFLTKYLATMNQTELIKHYSVYATSDAYTVAANFRRFDFERSTWLFEWKEWLAELEKDPQQNSPGLVDPAEFNFSADRICLRILEKIEENSATSFIEIASAIGLTPQDIRYHYFRHIMGRGLISGFRPIILPYPRSVSNAYTLVLSFHNRKSLESFTELMASTFIAIGYAKIIGENSLIVHTYLPRVEEDGMHNFLLQMSETGYLDDYFYVPIATDSFRAWSIRPDKFDGETWAMNQEAYLTGLREIVEKSSIVPKSPVQAVQLNGTPQVTAR